MRPRIVQSHLPMVASRHAGTDTLTAVDFTWDPTIPLEVVMVGSNANVVEWRFGRELLVLGAQHYTPQGLMDVHCWTLQPQDRAPVMVIRLDSPECKEPFFLFPLKGAIDYFLSQTLAMVPLGQEGDAFSDAEIRSLLEMS